MGGVAPEAAEIAARLTAARTTRVPAPPPAELPLDLARAVRDQCIARLEQESPVVGYKVSLSTNSWGVLTGRMVHRSGVALSRASFFGSFWRTGICDPAAQPRDARHRDRGFPMGRVGAQRRRSFRLSHGRHDRRGQQHGGRAGDWSGLDAGPRSAFARRADIDTLGRTHPGGGMLREVMGSPVEAVLWLIGELAVAGRSVAAGQMISSGCPCHTLVTVPDAGGEWAAVVEGLAATSVTFD